MWYWKFHKQLQLAINPTMRGTSAINTAGNLEFWDWGLYQPGIINEFDTDVDGGCVGVSSVFAGLGTQYAHFGPSVYTDSYYESYYYNVLGTKYFNITRKDKNGNILGNVKYHTGASFMDTARIIEISSTHMLWLLNWGSFEPYPNDTWAIVLPIPSSTTIISIPMTTLTLNPDVLTETENLRAFHQPPYHDSKNFSANLNMFYANTAAKTVIPIGASPWPGDGGYPLTHKQPGYVNNWVTMSSYDTPGGTYTQYITNMAETLVSNTIEYEWDIVIDFGLISETQFVRADLRLTSPYVDNRFPILVFANSLEFLVPTSQGVYSFLNPISQYNTNACELWKYYQYDIGLGTYQFSEFGYGAWYIDNANVYVMTRDSDNDTDDTFGYRIWKYIGIGTAMAGPVSTTSHRTTNRYGR